MHEFFKEFKKTYEFWTLLKHGRANIHKARNKNLIWRLFDSRRRTLFLYKASGRPIINEFFFIIEKVTMEWISDILN